MIDEFRCLACSCTFETGCKQEAAERDRPSQVSDVPQNIPYHRIVVRKRNYPGIRGEALAATAARRRRRTARREERGK